MQTFAPHYVQRQISLTIREVHAMPSMKDVARRSGVSISTVSRVISTKVPVDSATKSKVLRAIEELGYKPNLLAMGLRSKSGRFIGLAVPEIEDPVFARLINHIEHSVVACGYDLILGNTHSDEETESRFINHLVRRHADGIIFSRVSDRSRTLEELMGVDIPVVVLDRAPEENGTLFSVVLNNRMAGRLAGEYLANNGHRKVGCITGPKEVSLCRTRLEGFREGLAIHGIELEEERVFEGNFHYEAGIEAVDYFRRYHPDITAIWTQDDQMAVGALKGLVEKGVRVPDDVSLIGMDDVQISSIVHPSLTTIAQPFRQMGEKAVDIILDSDRYAEGAKRRWVFNPSLVVRESTRHL